MFKKILVVTSILAITGLLVLGAVNRTLAKTGESANVGANRSKEVASEALAGQTTSVYAQGNGRGAGGNRNGAQGQEYLPAAQSGETYQPQYLDAQAYQDILSAQSGRGAGGNRGGWGGQGGQGRQGG